MNLNAKRWDVVVAQEAEQTEISIWDNWIENERRCRHKKARCALRYIARETNKAMLDGRVGENCLSRLLLLQEATPLSSLKSVGWGLKLNSHMGTHVDCVHILFFPWVKWRILYCNILPFLKWVRRLPSLKKKKKIGCIVCVYARSPVKV